MICPRCSREWAGDARICGCCGLPLDVVIPDGYTYEPASGLYYSTQEIVENGVRVRRVLWYAPPDGGIVTQSVRQESSIGEQWADFAQQTMPRPQEMRRTEPVRQPAVQPVPVQQSVRMEPPVIEQGAGVKFVLFTAIFLLVGLAAAVAGHFMGAYTLPFLPVLTDSVAVSAASESESASEEEAEVADNDVDEQSSSDTESEEAQEPTPFTDGIGAGETFEDALRDFGITEDWFETNDVSHVNFRNGLWQMENGKGGLYIDRLEERTDGFYLICGLYMNETAEQKGGFYEYAVRVANDETAYSESIVMHWLGAEIQIESKGEAAGEMPLPDGVYYLVWERG